MCGSRYWYQVLHPLLGTDDVSGDVVVFSPYYAYEVDGYNFLWLDYHGVITRTFLIGEFGLNSGFI